MPKKRRTRGEASERHRARRVAQKDNQRNGTVPADTVASWGGLLETFLAAAQFSITFIIIFLVFIRWMYWLSVFDWSKSRCQLLSPCSLKMAELKSLLEERGHNVSQLSTQEDLEAAVLETGGVMKIEMEAFLEADDNFLGVSQWNADGLETGDRFMESVPQKTVGVYLVLRSTILERRTMGLKPWRQFQHRLWKNGVRIVFVGCGDSGYCVTPNVMLVPIWISNGHKDWSYLFYAGPMRPSDIFQWITKTLSENVLRANSTADIFGHPHRSNLSMVAHSSRPLPLSYAVLASELRSTASFFWVEKLDRYLPDRASLMVFREESFMTYDRGQFLNQREIRWLVSLSTTDLDDFRRLVVGFVVLITMTIPLVAEGSVWQRVKAMFWFLLLCFLVILIVAWNVRHPKDTIEAPQFLAAIHAALVNQFRPNLLLFRRLSSESPFMWMVLPVYIIMAIDNSDNSQFFYKYISAFIMHIFTVFKKTSVSPKTASVTTVSAATSTQKRLEVAKATTKITSDISMATINVPPGAAKTTARIASNVTEATITVALDFAKAIAKITSSITKAYIEMPHDVAKTMPEIPSDVTMTTGGADGRKGYEANDPSIPNQRLRSVAQSQSLQHQCSSPSADPHQQDPVALPSPSNGTSRAYSTSQPFEYPPLMDSANRDHDKTTTKQMARIRMQKICIQPIISDKELRLSAALQKSDARDPRSFELASRTVPRCFYCKAVFQPTSEVRVLACRDIFHPGCMDKWMKEGNIDCPICLI